MQLDVKHKIDFNLTFSEKELSDGIFIAVLHANRVPPHIGLIIDKEYHSLSIKGKDKNVPLKALLKNIEQRKISSLFLKLKPPSLISEFLVKKQFIECIDAFPKVAIDVATCISPIKLFFEKQYGIEMQNVHFLYELIPALSSAGILEGACSYNLNELSYELPYYTFAEINAGIEEANKVAVQIKQNQ